MPNQLPETDKKEQHIEFTEEQQEVLRSIRSSKIIFPILIGVGVVIFLLLRQFNIEEFNRIEWTNRVWIGVVLAVLIVAMKHLAYATRLYILSNHQFSFRKCIQLIVIWEFSSAVSPTSVGGSAVAFFVLAQERLSVARTATIVLYTIVLDTFFFVTTIPLLLVIFGPTIIRPELTKLSFSNLDFWSSAFFVSYGIMIGYGTFFYLGLFHFPSGIKSVLVFFTKIKFLNRFHKKAVKLGDDIIIASQEMKKQNWKYHVGGLLATMVAWSCRFLLLCALITGFSTTISADFWTQYALYARLETMFVIILFSPTPGGAGFVEVLFSGFLSDYVQDDTSALIISTIWRLITYYAYLIAGAIIIPSWIRRVLMERRKHKLEQH